MLQSDFAMAIVNALRKRKVMTLNERTCVIKLSNKGDSARKIAESFAVGKMQVQTIICNKESILKGLESGMSGKRNYSQVQYDNLNKLV